MKMRTALAGSVVALMCFALAAQTRQSSDESLLRPSDRAYPDAKEFSRFLNENGLTVTSIHRSTLENSFHGVNKAAFFKTDKGILEVIFFPDSEAEKVSVTERRDGGRYIYSFHGQPHPDPRDTWIAGYPEYFIAHGGWFIVTNDENLSNAVKSLF